MTTQPMSQLAARESLAGWLSRELAAEDCRDAAIQDLSAPGAGYSGKTVFATVSCTDPDGTERVQELVFRVQVPDQQLFVAPDALRQARVMSALAGRPGVPVPAIRFTENDPQVLGAGGGQILDRRVTAVLRRELREGQPASDSRAASCDIGCVVMTPSPRQNAQDVRICRPGQAAVRPGQRPTGAWTRLPDGGRQRRCRTGG